MALPGISKEEIALRNLHNASRERLLNAADSPKASEAVKGELRRMAGDRLKNTADDIIDELREVEGIREDSLIQEAMDDLYSLRERNKDIAGEWDEALGSANIGREYLNNATNLVDGDIQMVSGIDALTPQAVQLNWASDNVNGTAVPTQTRFHTRYEENPVTGQQDVLPMRDVSSNAPLVTQLGVVGQSVRPQDVDFMDSDEFLGKRIMQLQGIPVEANNTVDKYAVDLINPSNREKIDVEVLNRDNLDRFGVGFQVYTEMAPASMAGARPRDKRESQSIAREMSREIKPMLEQKMSAGGMSLMEAIDSLDREGLLTDASGYESPFGGKLLKERGTYVDKLVGPVVSAEDASLNESTKVGRKDQRKYVMPLEGAKLSDANRAKDLLSDLKGREGLSQLSLRPMPGNGAGTRPSVKAYLQVPQNSSMVQNLEGAVRQLFAEQKKKPSVRRVSR